MSAANDVEPTVASEAQALQELGPWSTRAERIERAYEVGAGVSAQNSQLTGGVSHRPRT